MSVKIYNGYTLPNYTLQELLQFCREAKKVIEDTVKEHARSFCKTDYYIKNYVELLDRAMHVKRTGQRDPLVDVSFDVTFFPIKNKLLAITFMDNKTLEKAWESLKGVEEYSYWNNTDKPEEVSKADWKNRENDWNEALLDGDAVPSKNGFSFTLHDERLPFPQEIFTEEEILKYRKEN